MKVPKSTYVMSVVVLGLFGIAIAKTAGSKDRHHRDDDESTDPEATGDDPDSDRGIQEYEHEQAVRKTAELEAQAALDKLVAAVGPAYGAEAASMGSLLAGLTFGTERSAVSTEINDRLAAFRRQTQSELTLGELSSRTIDRIEIKPHSSGQSEPREELCGRLYNLLKDTWGNGTRESVTYTTIWLNPATHVRATFLNEYGQCALSFSAFAAPAEWIDRTPTSVVPVAAVGQPATKLADAVKSTIADMTITWTGPGLGAGTQATQLVASVVRGKVALVNATTIATEDTRSELVEHLTAKFGKPKSTSNGLGSDLLTWNSRPQIVLTVGDGDTVALSVGKL